MQHSLPHESENTNDYSLVHETRTRWVVMLTAATMMAEISIGFYTNSMALTAEGWHMSTHVFAIGLTWLAYFFTRKYAQSEKITFDRKKILAISGFTSAVMLQIIAVIMVVESVDRLIHPLEIKYKEAIYVAIAGLIVNVISTFLLHHEKEHSDHNIRAAYMHVLTDVLTSLLAITALTAAVYFNYKELDALSGILGSIVITRWALSLIFKTGRELVERKKD